MVAIVACMRKLLTILNAMLRDQAMWNAAKHLQLAQSACLCRQLLTPCSVRAEPVEASAVLCAPFDRLRANGLWLRQPTNQNPR